MIVQCPACRALVDVASASVDVEQRRAGLQCSACGAVTWLGEGAPVVDTSASAPAPSPPVAATAPLVSAAPVSAPAASSQALSEEQQAAIAGRVEAIDVVDAEELKADFIALLQQWDDEDAHKKMIQRGLLAGQLAVVGQGYRAVLEVREDDARAEQGRDRVLAAAMTQLKELPSQSVDTAGSKKALTFIALLVCTVLIAVSGYYIFAVGMPQLTDPDRAYLEEPPLELDRRPRPTRPAPKRLPTQQR